MLQPGTSYSLSSEWSLPPQRRRQIPQPQESVLCSANQLVAVCVEKQALRPHNAVLRDRISRNATQMNAHVSVSKLQFGELM